MPIGFIGAGKVATAFGRYLHGHGVPICGFFDRHDNKKAHAAEMTRSQAYDSAAQVAKHCDVLLITTQDDQIEAACNDLCRTKSIANRHFVGHMSGAHATGILLTAEQQGATVFSLHPLQAFAEEEKALSELSNTYFSLEGIEDNLTPIKQILHKTGNPYFCILPEHKSLYHLCACILSNYLVTLMDSGLTALEKSRVDRKQGFQAMYPLIKGTLSNIARLGTLEALTGPIARGDAGTIEQHLQALKRAGLHDLESLYRHLGLHTLNIAEQKALQSPQKAAIVRQVLENKIKCT